MLKQIHGDKMTADFFSKLPEHSKHKHEILVKYLPTFRRIAKLWKEFLYIDGFAGPGRYDDGSEGSPILAIKSLNNLFSENVEISENCIVKCVFVEANDKNFEKLVENLEDLEHNTKNIAVEYYQGEFEHVFPAIMEDYDEFSTSPSLFFLDPFGYNQIPFWIYEEIFSLKKPEIIVSLMVNPIARFHEDTTKFNAYCRTFGSDDWKDNFDKNYDYIEDKEEAFSLFFQDLLKEKTKATHTNRYIIRHAKTNQRIYDIIHATTHFKGLKVMKDVMFGMGIKGTFEYHGKKENILRANRSLFEFIKTPPPEFEAIKKWIIALLDDGEFLTFDEIKEIIYENTEWVETQLRSTLKEMEKSKIIEIERITSKTSKGIRGLDRIRLIKNN